MIVRFEVANFRSFHEPTELLLTATAERQHRERLATHKTAGGFVLPIAAIYGANAAGKSNLTAAITYLKELVCKGRKVYQPLGRQPFRLDTACAEQPTRFALDFIALDEQLYRYELAVSDQTVEREALIHVRPTSEAPIFLREAGSFTMPGLTKLAANADRRAFLRFTSEGTRPNQPFLAEAAARGVAELDPVISWFHGALGVLEPDSRPIALEEVVIEDGEFRKFLLERLRAADTGIEDLVSEDRMLDDVEEISTSTKESLRAELREGEVKLLRSRRNRAVIFLVRYRGGEIHVCSLRARHTGAGGHSADFAPEDESDGTRRYMELSMAFYALGMAASAHVFIIDELDRSLHPLLAREAVEAFLAGCGPHTRTQLIFTTHDVTLMTQDLFRRDEIWLAEKGPAGATALASFGDFADVRHDKDLRRNYLQGRFGGVPLIHHRPFAPAAPGNP